MLQQLASQSLRVEHVHSLRGRFFHPRCVFEARVGSKNVIKVHVFLEGCDCVAVQLSEIILVVQLFEASDLGKLSKEVFGD